MANIYKVRLSARNTTSAAGSVQSEYLTGTLVGISWPGVGAQSTMRYSTGQIITFSVTPQSSQQYFMKILQLAEKTTGKRWYPMVRVHSTDGTYASTLHSQQLPLCRDKIKMNYEASSHKSCAHLDMDLFIDGPPGLMGATDYHQRSL